VVVVLTCGELKNYVIDYVMLMRAMVVSVVLNRLVTGTVMLVLIFAAEILVVLGYVSQAHGVLAM
jgi:hypothetical protein